MLKNIVKGLEASSTLKINEISKERAENINRIDAESFSGSRTMTKQMASCLGLHCNQHQ